MVCEYHRRAAEVKDCVFCRGLEKALDQIEAERNAKAGEEAAAMARAAGTEVCFPLISTN